ncbi:MAG TPA: hypothetical protein VFT29_09545 [Gemmatimonadaceae bacterium]|nr:hypothetical protein [Gemmatimonadaceae bacterium]
MRKTVVTLALLAAVPLAAQQPQAEKDQTVRVKSTGLPPGWTVRIDDKETRYTVNDTRFETMGSGFHVTSGPAALYYNAKDVVSGPFTATASFGQRKAPTHPEAYGLFIGGTKLETPEQQYLYFLVRGDGKYYVAHRAGKDVHTVVNWTDSPAVNKQNEAGAATNVLAIQVTKDSVLLSANSQRVTSFAKSAAFNTDGQAGIRVNHNLDVHIGGFSVKKD